MFTGLVEGIALVRSFQARGDGARMWLEAPELPADLPAWEPVMGESIAISGCCLSAVEADDGALAFDLSAETLAKTWLGRLLRPGSPGSPGGRRPVNVERSLRLGDRLGGHMVSGHVDAMGSIVAIEDSGDGGRLFRFEVPKGFERYLVEKGSVTIDGISLTVVEPAERRFAVAVIPETLRRTSLGVAREGDAIHLEADMIGKWIERLLRP